jgi:predicted PurR-regulated permease PerM
MIEFLLHIIINIIISIFIIYIIHSTWEYFKDTYTNKKTKDLVNTQITKYQQMMEEMQQNTKIESISKTDIQNMNDDLTLFMEQQPTE